MKTLSAFLSEIELRFIKLQNWNNLSLSLPNLKTDYFILMSNSKVPCVRGMGKYNIFHCQFPFDMNKPFGPRDVNFIESYDICIVNSEFTRDHLKLCYTNVFLPIKILYPPCLSEVNKQNYFKDDNTFAMIGRIFEHDEMANNKFFDKAIEVFNKIKVPLCKLIIIGSVKSQSFYEKLVSMIKDKSRIEIIADANESVKESILKKTKYFIQLTGMLDDVPKNQEHFGISMIEAINYGCIPICFEGGYAKYIINDKNGFLIKDEFELFNLITNLPVKTFDTIDVSNYTYEKFKEGLMTLM